MSRVKRGVTSHAKHKKVLRAAKGFFGRRKNTIRIAKQAVEKSMQYAYRDRKNRKREFRALWIQRINAAVREHGLTYSRFISGLITAGIEVDRKVLSDLAINEPAAFAAIVERWREFGWRYPGPQQPVSTITQSRLRAASVEALCFARLDKPAAA
jgi:large subunit ribosomal protein L20